MKHSKPWLAGGVILAQFAIFATPRTARSTAQAAEVVGTRRQFFLPFALRAPVGPTIAGCPVFPADNPWNRDISNDPVDPRSDQYLASVGADVGLHPDFSSDPQYGLPYVVVSAGQPFVPVSFTYADQSDPGPYPIPADASIQVGEDHHVLVVDSASCLLYELYHATYVSPGWTADSGAIWNLRTDATRPRFWTSADEAGLPVFPGLVRYNEIAAGEIRHALRFTVPLSQAGFVAPASHCSAGNPTDPSLPPMGLRFRLKADVDISGFGPHVQIILRALQRYGMIVADDGGPWYIQGAPDPRFDDSEMHTLDQIVGANLEAVQSGPVAPCE